MGPMGTAVLDGSTEYVRVTSGYKLTSCVHLEMSWFCLHPCSVDTKNNQSDQSADPVQSYLLETFSQVALVLRMAKLQNIFPQ